MHPSVDEWINYGAVRPWNIFNAEKKCYPVMKSHANTSYT
jgi:hypothetical protein